jgi:Tol biopolymer transport system component
VHAANAVDGRQPGIGPSARLLRYGERTEIYTMAADGSDVHQVTSLGGYSYEPAWAPDGSMIVFSSDGGEYPSQQGIYVVRPDGSGLRRIVALPRDVPDAVWLDAPRISPDGRHVAYVFIRGGRDTPHMWAGEVDSLWVADIDGSNAHRVVPWGTHVGDADWSPDGTRLVFETTQQHLGNAPSVMVVDADGGNRHTLTDDVGIVGIGGVRGNGRSTAFRVETSYDPVWSPDGTTIMFSHGSFTASGGGDGVQVIHPDGSGQPTSPRWASAPTGSIGGQPLSSSPHPGPRLGGVERSASVNVVRTTSRRGDRLASAAKSGGSNGVPACTACRCSQAG